MADGLTRATPDDPFAVPRRMASSRTQSTSIGDISHEFNQLNLNASESIEEYQFGFEEALYLVEKLKTISICSPESQTPLSALELFDAFEKQDHSFFVRYYGAY